MLFFSTVGEKNIMEEVRERERESSEADEVGAQFHQAWGTNGS